VIALSRRPTPQELEALVGHVRNAADPAAAYGDVLWAILNMTEFIVNH